jgi:NTE family protein
LSGAASTGFRSGLSTAKFVRLIHYPEFMPTALVLSAGGMFAAWEVGVWKSLKPHFAPDLIVGASAGALNGWAIAGGAAPADLEREWLDPLTAHLMRHRALHEKARHLFETYRPQVPFGLTVVDIPRFRPKLVRTPEIEWEHLAATCSIPLLFPPIRIGGSRYVDGGLRGALPLWAAQEMGATRAIALNCLNTRSFRMLHRLMRWQIPRATALDVVRVEPSVPLGSMLDTAIWSAAKIERWIALGERDGNRALPSIA